jgi:hypothetical protein
MRYVLLWLFLTSAALANTVRIVPSDYDSVNNAITGLASGAVNAFTSPLNDGDECDIQAGTATWTKTLSVTKNIVLRGATTITGTDPSNFAVSDGTIIKDGESGSGSTTGSVIYCNFNGSHSGNPIIQGITIDGTSGADAGGHAIHIEGNHHSVRVTQVHFINQGGGVTTSDSRYCLFSDGETFFVMDHCLSQQATGTEKFSVNMSTYAPASGGGPYTNGDGSWVDDPQWQNGNSRASYFEDCGFFSYTDLAHTTLGGKHGNFDSLSGGRRVIRHCYLKGVVYGLHGTESGGRKRGSRVAEIYLNTIDLQGSGSAGTDFRSGTGVIWGNTFKTDSAGNPTYLTANRQLSFFASWGGATGFNPLDSNDANGQYWPTTGTATVTAVGTNTITQTGAAWTPNNKWAGYEVSNSVTTSTNYKHNALIISNTADTLTLVPQFIGPQPFAVNDTFVIYRLNRGSLDQPGFGRADLLSGNPVGNTTSINQNIEPLYGWMNTNQIGTTAPVAFTNMFAVRSNAPIPTFKPNRDYFQQVGGVQTSPTAPFNGTVGTGFGTHANRPATCTASSEGAQPQAGTGNVSSVGYWETDGTNANTLFTCTATDTWTPYYQPYTYPHPLTGCPSPIITSNANATFTTGTAANCSGTVNNCFQLTTCGFSGTPTFAITSGTLPAGITLNGSGQISGTPTGTTATVTVTATAASQSATQNLTVTVVSPNTPPTVSITTNNTVFIAPATITITASPADADGTITKVDFYNGTTLIGTVNASPWVLTLTNVAAGNYSYTAKATDNGGAVSPASNTIVVAVGAASSGPAAPANIKVSP